jgi:catechol 2,3-dioxygenase-like lactoylglutathione lyase family enzyme
MSEAMAATSVPTKFGGVTPILPVRDLDASVAYYVEKLGFKVDFQAAIAGISRGRCALFLVEADQGHVGTWVWIGVDDVDAVFEEYRLSGATIRQPPTNFSWACEMQVEDPDGNVLRLGSEPKASQPFGPWLDMRGDRWFPTSSGEWRRADRE